MKFISLIGLVLVSKFSMAQNNLNIEGKYDCVDVIVESSDSTIKLVHETSLKEVTVTQLEDESLIVQVVGQKLSITSIDSGADSMTINGILVTNLGKLGSSYDKVAMTFFNDVNQKNKILLEGLTIVAPRNNPNEPHGFKFVIDCTRK